MFGAGLTTYLLSKEIWVMEHDFFYVPAIATIMYFVIKKGGPTISKYLDKEVDVSGFIDILNESNTI